jgi:hypothetical protein
VNKHWTLRPLGRVGSVNSEGKLCVTLPELPIDFAKDTEALQEANALNRLEGDPDGVGPAILVPIMRVNDYLKPDDDPSFTQGEQGTLYIVAIVFAFLLLAELFHVVLLVVLRIYRRQIFLSDFVHPIIAIFFLSEYIFCNLWNELSFSTDDTFTPARSLYMFLVATKQITNDNIGDYIIFQIPTFYYLTIGAMFFFILAYASIIIPSILIISNLIA